MAGIRSSRGLLNLLFALRSASSLLVVWRRSLVTLGGLLMDIKCQLSSAVDPLATSVTASMGALSELAPKKPKGFGT